MLKALTIIAAATIVSGCTRPVVNVEAPFDIRAAQAQVEPGTGTVAGAAYMLKRSGDMVTCADNEVYLVPATAYAQERFTRMYASTPTTTRTSLKSVNDVLFRRQAFFPDPAEYALATKVTTCDAQGDFRFLDVKDGDYFVNTSVYWHEHANEGGTLARRVIVENGVSPKVVLTP